MAGKNGNGLSDRIRIQEKALQEMADRLMKREAEFNEVMEDVQGELKAIKLFLSRTMPDFKKEFPGILKKLKAA